MSAASRYLLNYWSRHQRASRPSISENEVVSVKIGHGYSKTEASRQYSPYTQISTYSESEVLFQDPKVGFQLAHTRSSCGGHDSGGARGLSRDDYVTKLPEVGGTV